MVDTTGSDDDEPAEKYWRAEDIVAKASMDELTGRWLIDEKRIFDHDVAEDTWADCREASGDLDMQAEAEVDGPLRKRWIACWHMVLWKT